VIHECSGENDPRCSGEKNMKCQKRIYNRISYISDKNIDAPFSQDLFQRKLPLTLFLDTLDKYFRKYRRLTK
jgi:hypothetical protein